MANLGGDPNFRPCPDLVRNLTRHLPSCPKETTALPLPEITDEWLQNKLNRGPSTKATGEDGLNYYVLKLAGSSYFSWLRSCMHAVLKNTAPPEWSHALLALLFKKGDPRDPQNYRPICLIQSLQKLTAAFLNDQLVQFSEKFSLIHKSQHGGLKNHRCGDHIYDVVARNIQMGGPAYHLYIDFNKAFNSVPHETLWSVLRAYQLPDSMIEAFKNLNSNPVDKPVVHGTPHSSYKLQRGVRQGCPASPTLFILFINVLLFNIDQLSLQSPHSSLHAFVDDILFRSNSTKDMEMIFNFFDTTARAFGMDMNVSKTQLHALYGAPQTTIESSAGSQLSTIDPDTGQPYKFYKYLGVYFFTSEDPNELYSLLANNVRSFFDRLSPLNLTMTELTSLTNCQLIPTLLFRLLASTLPEDNIELLHKLIWKNLSKHGKVPANTSAKDIYQPKQKSGYNLAHFRLSYHAQIFNYGMRYYIGDGPPQTQKGLVEALMSPEPNILQENFGASVDALGYRVHGFGRLNPCKISVLKEGETVYVPFGEEYHTHTVHDRPRSTIVSFEVDKSEAVLTDHDYFTLTPPPTLPSPQYPDPTHQSLCPPLAFLPPMRIPPPMGLTVESTDDLGVSLTVPTKVVPTDPETLQQWGCIALAEARRLPVQLHSVWAYLDGSAFSSNGDKVGSAAVVAHQDTTKAYAFPCPYDTSEESEFWALVQFLRHLIKTGFRGSIGICIDNSQVVRIADKVLGKSLPLPSTSNHGTWASILEDLQLYIHFSWTPYWIKAHVGFHGNELADTLAKWCALSFVVTPPHLHPPPLVGITYKNKPVVGKCGNTHRKNLLPKHDHLNIHTKLSFDWVAHHSWFSSFATKWALGVQGVKDQPPFFDTTSYYCNACCRYHPQDPASRLAFCDLTHSHRENIILSWDARLIPAVRNWLLECPWWEKRLFVRSLVPKSLLNKMISTLAPQQESKARALIWDTMPARRTRFTSAIKSYLEWLRDQPPPDRIVGQGPNTFFQHHGVYSTSYSPAPITHPDPSPLPSTLNDVPSKPKPRPQNKRRQSTSCPPPRRGIPPKPAAAPHNTILRFFQSQSPPQAQQPP